MTRTLKSLKDTLASELQALGVNLAREEAYDQKRCVKCGDEARQFRDRVSQTEYRLTIWCQKCQDEFFGGPKG